MCIRDSPSISTSLDNKPDENSAMIQLLLKLDKKLDEQKIDSDIKFNELKNEIKMGHDKLIKKCDQLIKKLDNLNVVESQLETQKVNGGTQQNAELNINLFKINNSSNECNIDNSNNTSSKIVVLEKDKHDNESTMNDNEIFEFMKSERKLRESILVQGVQGLSLIHI